MGGRCYCSVLAGQVLRNTHARVFDSRWLRRLVCSPDVYICSGTHPNSYSVGTEPLSMGAKWPGVKLTTHLRLYPKLRTIGDTLPLPPYSMPLWRAQGLLFSTYVRGGLHRESSYCVGK